MKSYLFPNTVKQDSKKNIIRNKAPTKTKLSGGEVGGGVELLYLHTILIFN